MSTVLTNYHSNKRNIAVFYFFYEAPKKEAIVFVAIEQGIVGSQQLGLCPKFSSFPQQVKHPGEPLNKIQRQMCQLCTFLQNLNITHDTPIYANNQTLYDMTMGKIYRFQRGIRNVQ